MSLFRDIAKNHFLFYPESVTENCLKLFEPFVFEWYWEKAPNFVFTLCRSKMPLPPRSRSLCSVFKSAYLRGVYPPLVGYFRAADSTLSGHKHPISTQNGYHRPSGMGNYSRTDSSSKYPFDRLSEPGIHPTAHGFRLIKGGERLTRVSILRHPQRPDRALCH